MTDDDRGTRELVDTWLAASKAGDLATVADPDCESALKWDPLQIDHSELKYRPILARRWGPDRRR
jgi:ketosteroid isomerase-like protein